MKSMNEIHSRKHEGQFFKCSNEYSMNQMDKTKTGWLLVTRVVCYGSVIIRGEIVGP